MKLRHIIGDNIRCLRGDLIWTQETLGQKTKISRDYIGRIERGEVNLGIDHLQRIGSALKIEPHYLLIDGHCFNLLEARKKK